MKEKLEQTLREAYQDLEQASKNKSRSSRHEIAYGIAYQNLVKAGFRHQLPAKMRKHAYSPGHAKG